MDTTVTGRTRRLDIAFELLGPAGAMVVSARQPEQRLLLGVLEDALNTFQKGVALRRYRSREFRQAEAWLASNDTTWCFSYVNVCDFLGLDVSGCRDALARWRRWMETGGGRNTSYFRPPSDVSGEDTPENGCERIGALRYHVNRDLPLH